MLIEYLKDVAREVKAISFPKKMELSLTTIFVFIVIAITVTFVFFTDFIISSVIKTLLGIL